MVASQKLVAVDGARDDQFGAAVAVSNNTVVVGAPVSNAGLGSVYIYTGAAFSPQLSPLSETAANFGSSVSISDNRIIVGAIGGSVAYAYTRSGTEWQRCLVFLNIGTRLGGAAAISGSTAIIGAVAGDQAYILQDDDLFFNGFD